MTTQHEQYTAAINREKANDIQREAVRAHLKKYGEISRKFANEIGVPGCGVVLNLAARIMELREEGMDIKTEHRGGVCWYVYRKMAFPGTGPYGDL